MAIAVIVVLVVMCVGSTLYNGNLITDKKSRDQERDVLVNQLNEKELQLTTLSTRHSELSEWSSAAYTAQEQLREELEEAKAECASIGGLQKTIRHLETETDTLGRMIVSIRKEVSIETKRTDAVIEEKRVIQNTCDDCRSAQRAKEEALHQKFVDEKLHHTRTAQKVICIQSTVDQQLMELDILTKAAIGNETAEVVEEDDDNTEDTDVSA